MTEKHLILPFWALGQLWGEQLPHVALTLMEMGYDSPSLREMAAEQTPSLRDAGPLFARCLTELQMEVPTREVAALCLGRYYAQEIISGRTEAFDGARKIWQLSLLIDIEPFRSFAWPDTEGDIIQSAQHLLAYHAD